MNKGHSNSSIIDASQLSTYQLCRRRWLLERDWRWMKWHPKSLFDHCLRTAIFHLSSGSSLDQILASATEQYLSAAANPGLDLLPGADPYQIAGDWCATMTTVLTAISRLTLLSVQRLLPVEMQQVSNHTSQLSWLPLSFADESGTLHRWITVDAWDADAQARAVHDWRTVGDMAMLDAPMTLHVVEVGSLRNGRRHSPWCRAYKHPVIAGRMRFQRPDGKGGWRSLRGDQWEQVFLSDLHAYSPDQWVDLMEKDGIISNSLLRHLAMRSLSEESTALVRRQILQEAQAMHKLSQQSPDWSDVPMARGACDGWRPCPHQLLCYQPAESAVGPEESGLYRIAGAVASERSLIPT